MATPQIIQTPEPKQLPESSAWIPRLEPTQFADRYCDVLADLMNHGGAALTDILRFFALTACALGLLVAETFLRLDNRILRKFEGFGVSRG